MPPFVDDPVGYPNDKRLLRVLRDSNFWHPRDLPIRASSGAFQDTTRENSCFDLDCLTPEHFQKIAETYPGSRLATVLAADARRCGYSVCDEPSDFLPGHVVICPPRDAGINAYIKMAKCLAHSSLIYEQGIPRQ
jgi:hypothetical protein